MCAYANTELRSWRPPARTCDYVDESKREQEGSGRGAHREAGDVVGEAGDGLSVPQSTTRSRGHGGEMTMKATMWCSPARTN